MNVVPFFSYSKIIQGFNSKRNIAQVASSRLYRILTTRTSKRRRHSWKTSPYMQYCMHPVLYAIHITNIPFGNARTEGVTTGSYHMNSHQDAIIVNPSHTNHIIKACKPMYCQRFVFRPSNCPRRVFFLICHKYSRKGQSPYQHSQSKKFCFNNHRVIAMPRQIRRAASE